ncbi:MAG: RES family NAD+ phosphorylase [Candidatus Velthaea sp.]
MRTPFSPAARLSGRPGAETAALAALVDGNPGELQILLEILALTDPFARDALAGVRALGSLPRYTGANAAAVMLPFLLRAPSRFSSGRYGVLYGAESTDTAAAEVRYHHARRLRAANAASGTMVLLTLWAFVLDCDVVDVRDYDAAIYAPDTYTAAQALGARIQANGDAAILYRSVRRPDGECVAVLQPAAVTNMEKRDDWRLVWDGSAISETLRVA